LTTTIVIPVETRNPGAYLAACGVVEIAGTFDPCSLSSWRRHAVSLGTTSLLASACAVETDLRESDLVAALHEALADRERWNARVLDGQRVSLATVGKDTPLASVSVSIRIGERCEEFTIDYWYHRLTRVDDPKLKDRLAEGKSAWKFWGGRMSVQKTLLGEQKKPGLITALPVRDDHAPSSIADLISLERATGSSFNLDAAARRGALDRGLAANEAKRGTGDVAAARPALELLAAIGLSAFFPPRRIGGHRESGPHGTAGFNGDRLRYCAWGAGAPLPLARLLARGVHVPGMQVLDRFEARRTSAGGKNYRFEYARGVGSAPENVPIETEEEQDDDAGAEAG
jgi:CRISPR-associated protein Csb3